MSLQSKYATVVANELRHHAVWEPGEPVRLGDYGILQHGRFSVQGNVKDDYGLDFEVIRSRRREYAFRSDGVSESRGDARTQKPGVTTELRVGFRRADALYVSSPSAWTEHIKGLGRLLGPLQKDPSWRPEWVVVTRIYMASPAIILLSNADNADVKINLGADGVAIAGDAANEVGEQGSVALQLTGVHGALFMGLHRVSRNEVGDVLPRRRLLSRVMVLAGAGLVGGGALAAWLVIGMIRPTNGSALDVPTQLPQSAVRDEDGDTTGDRVELAINSGVNRPATAKVVIKEPNDLDPEHEDPDAATSIGLGPVGQVGHGGGSGAKETAGDGLTSTGTEETHLIAPVGDEPVTLAPTPAAPASEPAAPVVAAPPPRADDPPWWIGVALALISAVILGVIIRLRRRLDAPVEVTAAPVDDL